ncbi:MAG: radical SAM family heme chaperone HemW [Pseudomonadota bacterium]
MNAPPLGVYVHWPFCARICPYCDFNVYRDRGVDADRWADALTRDLAAWAARTPKRPLASLYFGGGTPSLMPTSVLAAVVETCARIWGFADDAEIGLEANPTDAEADRFAAFAAAGVNRLSVGVQSLRDDALAFLGRNHDAAGARRAIDAAMAAVGNVSFDLIYARPGQTAAAWRDELDEALAIGAPHLSVYQLTVEDGTAFERAVARGAWAPLDETREADLYDLAQEATAAAGLPAYEVSNHARPGAASGHNLLYWRGGDYVGVGPGAHGRLTRDGARFATVADRRPDAYLARVDETGVGGDAERLDRQAAFAERIMMGLRLVDGADIAGFEDERAAIAPAIAHLVEAGLLIDAAPRLRATHDGRRVLNALTGYLLADAPSAEGSASG